MTADPAAASVPRRTAPAAASVREPAYRRILLKLSGEALMGEDAYGINREVIDRIVAEIERSRTARRPGRRRDRRAATSFAASLPAPRAWTGRPPITWECSPR